MNLAMKFSFGICAAPLVLLSCSQKPSSPARDQRQAAVSPQHLPESDSEKHRGERKVLPASQDDAQDWRLKLRLDEIKAHRERVLREFADRLPRAGLDPKRHAHAVFGEGFELDGATIKISSLGCTLQVHHGGRNYLMTLDEMPSCRVSETGSQGLADIQRVRSREGRGLYIVNVQPDPEGLRCRTRMRSLRITRGGPRISSAGGPMGMCSYRDFDTMHYEIDASEDVPMPRAR